MANREVGTGIWAIDFAERNPQAKVIGVDLSLIQPPDIQDRVPNVEFFRDDVEDFWLWDEPFDFIHQRLMFSCCNDHKALAKTMFDHLKPGGWVEYQDVSLAFESDDKSHLGTVLHKWGHLAIAGAAAKGRDIEVARKYREYLIEAGFVDVVEEKFKLYANGWHSDPTKKLIGKYSLISMLEVCQGFSPKLLQEGLGMSADVVELMTRRLQEDMKDPNIHWYLPM
jgi:trans-aconitate methyltransferase